MWSDRETDQDCLGFSSNVEVLARCCTDDALSPLTLGIFGLWGSGKTSQMKMLKKRIDDTNEPGRLVMIGEVPCTIRLLPVALRDADFHDFHEYERLVDAAKTTDPQAHHRSPRRRSGIAVRGDNGA